MIRALYVGLQAPNRQDANVIHLPLIETIVRKDAYAHFSELDKATHIIMTSKTTVSLSQEHLQNIKVPIISVGKETTKSLKSFTDNILTAENECQEGIIALIEKLNINDPLFFWPHSALSRPNLVEYFEKKGYRFIEFSLYDTHFKAPEKVIDLETVDEIHFSSPSTVDAFYHFFGPPPKHCRLYTKGHVTQKQLIKKG